jgi:hypothetical protein
MARYPSHDEYTANGKRFAPAARQMSREFHALVAEETMPYLAIVRGKSRNKDASV